MGKYLALWALKKEVIPSDPDEYAKFIDMLSLMIKQGFENGHYKDWGVFASNIEGYVIFEGEFSELSLYLTTASPFVELIDVQQVLTLEETNQIQKEAIKTMKGP